MCELNFIIQHALTSESKFFLVYLVFLWNLNTALDKCYEIDCSRMPFHFDCLTLRIDQQKVKKQDSLLSNIRQKQS